MKRQEAKTRQVKQEKGRTTELERDIRNKDEARTRETQGVIIAKGKGME